ncbi:MAG: ATP-binding cassette domain-containing protein [Rhizobacter sp.]
MTRVARARWLAREVVQTSSMDCGPAALKCLLDGFGIEAHYGRLREACQTSIDGTSIDTLEEVAHQLGLQAEQVLVPPDHLGLPGVSDTPAIVVVRHADAGTHFVVVWRRVGPWVQVMDPAAGRRWLRLAQLREQLYRHDMLVDADGWRTYAASAEHLGALCQQLCLLGLREGEVQALVERAVGDTSWCALAALDASTRLVHTLVTAGGVRRGAEANRLVQSFFQRCLDQPGDRLRTVAEVYWPVLPEHAVEDAPAASARLRLRGAVLLRVAGRIDPAASPDAGPLSGELAAALNERAEPVWRTVWRLLREDGRATPLALCLAAAVTTVAVGLELLLFRGLFDLSAQLVGGGQRLGAAFAMIAFLLLLLALELPAARESMRLGRHLEVRLRAALLERLPRLHDRYFQSRPISDMADRAHGIQVARGLPSVALGLLQAVLDLALTLAGLVWLAPDSAAWVLAMAVAALAVPLLALPFLGERDLRVRTHAAALAGFYLDALMGLVPVRAHRAERAVCREHEALMVEWARSLRGWVGGAITADAVQGALCLGLAAAFVFSHFRAQGGVLGSDLLLVFWTLKIPALGQRVAGLARQVPAQRNALMRLLEPLSAPVSQPVRPHVPAATGGLSLRIEGGSVRAGGHEILRDIDLCVAAGEHVAVVGVSGAGKSSLVGLLLGWHRLAAGTLHIDGRALGADTAGAVEALRPSIAWVDPAVQLWNRSLLDNLLYASDDDALVRVGSVSEHAHLRHVAARLPQGLQTLLGEGGGLLSGGEGQRVRLARALLQEAPRLVLLDEPFRGLDRTQRHELLREACDWWQDSTVLCVTHDVGETLDFNRVLVVEDGRIVEDGAPAQLMTGSTRYRALVDAEVGLRERQWAGPSWRRLEMRDGLLVTPPVEAP